MQTTETVRLISKASDCNIRTFIACLFDNDLQTLVIEGVVPIDILQATWNAIYMEYVDMSGADIPELSSIKSIYALQCRMKQVELLFIAATDCCRFIGVPGGEEIADILTETIERLKTCGIKLQWKNNQTDFFQQIQKAKTRDKVNYVRLEKLIKELEIEREIERKKRPTSNNDVTLFYSMLNSLEAEGFRIDEEKTSVARLAIMINDQRKRIERQQRMN